ncbi:MAG: hypothetical protein KIT73_04500 [Burkholderiales bacterium]|nr:hypothetical protein [Burkholderiales bacterium]
MKLIAAALALVLAATVAFADEAALGIKIYRQSGISYVTGGNGDEAKAFEQIAKRYPVQIVFTVAGQHVDLDGVKVVVRDGKGDSVVEARSRGPLFYVNTPSGRWTFEAEFDGETITKTKDLTGRRYLVLDFDFKSAPTAQ